MDLRWQPNCFERLVLQHRAGTWLPPQAPQLIDGFNSSSTQLVHAATSHNGDVDFGCSSLLQYSGHFASRRAGRHHVVDQQHDLFFQARRFADAKRMANVVTTTGHAKRPLLSRSANRADKLVIQFQSQVLGN